MKYAVNLITILFVLGFSFYSFSSQNKLNVRISRMTEEITKIKTLSPDSKSVIADGGDSKTQDRVTKYGTTIIQIGGAGSRVIQTTSYNLEDHEYFSNSDNWVTYSLNGSADLIHIDCRDGYKMISCNNESSEIKLLDSKPVCGIGLSENVPQNRINVECIKE